MIAWPKHVVFDRALPLSESAAAGVGHRDMTQGELLAALLVTDLEANGNTTAADLVRAAMALPGFCAIRARAKSQSATISVAVGRTELALNDADKSGSP